MLSFIKKLFAKKTEAIPAPWPFPTAAPTAKPAEEKPAETPIPEIKVEPTVAETTQPKSSASKTKSAPRKPRKPKAQ